jgi:hypothetical protein
MKLRSIIVRKVKKLGGISRKKYIPDIPKCREPAM